MQFTQGRLGDMCDATKTPAERLEAQTEVTDMLMDRLIVADYGRKQPYLFCGFIPGSSILTKWPHRFKKCAAVHHDACNGSANKL